MSTHRTSEYMECFCIFTYIWEKLELCLAIDNSHYRYPVDCNYILVAAGVASVEPEAQRVKTAAGVAGDTCERVARDLDAAVKLSTTLFSCRFLGNRICFAASVPCLCRSATTR